MAHGLAGIPTLIILTINGSRLIKPNGILLEPSVIFKNATHFCIEFLWLNTTSGEVRPVTSEYARDIYWYAEYRPGG